MSERGIYKWNFTQKYKIWKFRLAAFGYENFKKARYEKKKFCWIHVPSMNLTTKADLSFRDCTVGVG